VKGTVTVTPEAADSVALKVSIPDSLTLAAPALEKADLSHGRALFQRTCAGCHTLFDEGGVIVAAADDELLELLRGSHWKDLFWRRREAVRLRMRFLVVGHALHEKALAPFTGITARGILMRVQPSLLAAEPARLVDALDARAASWIGNPATLSATRDLAPVPVLGVPGWCADNEREDYYDNEDYFRSGRRE